MRRELRWRLEAVFKRVVAWARQRSRRVPALRLVVGCPQITARRRYDPRAFFHVDHRRGKVCVHPAAARLGSGYLTGLILHELGHPMATRAWGRSCQEDADLAIRKFLGVRLHYRGPLLLEWVPDRVVRFIFPRHQPRSPARGRSSS